MHAGRTFNKSAEGREILGKISVISRIDIRETGELRPLVNERVEIGQEKDHLRSRSTLKFSPEVRGAYPFLSRASRPPGHACN